MSSLSNFVPTFLPSVKTFCYSLFKHYTRKYLGTICEGQRLRVDWFIHNSNTRGFLRPTLCDLLCTTTTFMSLSTKCYIYNNLAFNLHFCVFYDNSASKPKKTS